MSDSGKVYSDPLFVGLTRPPMFLGVTNSYVMLNGFTSLTYYIQTSDASVFLLAVLMHMIGYIFCFKEPLFFELWMLKIQKFNNCKNKSYHGANSYDMY
jgi:type IV secretion system protein VirB3